MASAELLGIFQRWTLGSRPSTVGREPRHNNSYLEQLSNFESICLAFGGLGILSALFVARSSLPLSIRSFYISSAALCIVGLLCHQAYQRWQASKNAPRFRFLDLPAELRENILLYTIDRDPSYPAKPKTAAQSPGWMSRLLPSRKPVITGGPALLLASRQLHDEYSAVLAKIGTFKLVINAHNYQKPAMWQVSAATFANLRHVRLELHLTPSMMGSFDPRNASQSPATEWPLYLHVCRALAKMARLNSLEMYVHACGDPLWNPLWLWHYASQAFKQADVKQLRSIRFKMDGPGLGENHIARTSGGCWEWRCRKEHPIRDESEGWLPVRELCAALYRECASCQLQKEEAERMNW